MGKGKRPRRSPPSVKQGPRTSFSQDYVRACRDDTTEERTGGRSRLGVIDTSKESSYFIGRIFEQ